MAEQQLSWELQRWLRRRAHGYNVVRQNVPVTQHVTAGNPLAVLGTILAGAAASSGSSPSAVVATETGLTDEVEQRLRSLGARLQRIEDGGYDAPEYSWTLQYPWVEGPAGRGVLLATVDLGASLLVAKWLESDPLISSVTDGDRRLSVVLDDLAAPSGATGLLEVYVGDVLRFSSPVAADLKTLLTAVPNALTVAGMRDASLVLKWYDCDLASDRVPVGVYNMAVGRTLVRTYSHESAVRGLSSRWPGRARGTAWRLWVYAPRSTHATAYPVYGVVRKDGRQFPSLDVTVTGKLLSVEPDSTMYLTTG